MSAQFIAHASFLTFAALLTYLWTSHPVYSTYTLQLIAILILLYFGTHALTKKRHTHRNIITLDLIILTTTILLLVTETGGLTSPLFFTIYFLLFAVALLLEIEATLLLTGILVIFLTILPTTDLTNLAHLTALVSMVMITPLAIFTAHQYERVLKERELRALTESQITKEETDTLLFLSLNLKKTLISALDLLSVIIPQTTIRNVRSDLQQLYQDLKELYTAADELQDAVDQETD